MSKRTSIAKALAEKFKEIDGTGSFQIDLHGNSYAKLKFWDEVNDFPCVYVVAGQEARQYMPADFSWGFLNVSIKVYTKGEEPLVELESLLEDIESLIDSSNGIIVYDVDNNHSTSELSITSITTDEGLLNPYGVGEINLLVRYQIMK